MIPRIVAGYASKVQPRRLLARLAALMLMLIAALAPPMASANRIAQPRDYIEEGSQPDQTIKVDEILRELYGSEYDKWTADEKNPYRECARDEKCLEKLGILWQLTHTH